MNFLDDISVHPRLTSLTLPIRSQGISGDSDPTGSYSGIESVLSELTQRRDEMAELWGTRKLRLDLSMRLRMFERNVMEVSRLAEMGLEGPRDLFSM